MRPDPGGCGADAAAGRQLSALGADRATQDGLQARVGQALVVFPPLGVVGVVSGYCLDLRDVDLTAAIVGAIAHTLRVTGPEPEQPAS